MPVISRGWIEIKWVEEYINTSGFLCTNGISNHEMRRRSQISHYIKLKNSLILAPCAGRCPCLLIWDCPSFHESLNLKKRLNGVLCICVTGYRSPKCVIIKAFLSLFSCEEYYLIFKVCWGTCTHSMVYLSNVMCWILLLVYQSRGWGYAGDLAHRKRAS